MAQRSNRQVNEQVVVLESPKSAIALKDALALIVGLVIGVGIFQTPSIVASNLGSNSAVLLAWFLGGVMSLIGALCYDGELATTYPHAGGNYYYFRRAFGFRVAFLFAWARMAVIQTGSIATVAFVFGDYTSQLLRLGDYSSSIYATFAVILLTSLNIVGVEQGKWAQNWLSIAKVLGLLLVVIVGATFIAPSVPPVTAAPATTQTNWGSAMVFVLFSFGGWNEAAYISAELHNVKKNMVRLLIWSEANANARAAKVTDRVQFRQQDLFKTDLSEATVVTYLLPNINVKLRPQLFKQLKPGTRIVSHDFDMGEWKPERVVQVKGPTREHTLYYWVVPKTVPANLR